MASPHTSATELRDRALLLAKELGVDPEAWYVRVLEEEQKEGLEPDLGALVRAYWELQRVTERADLRDTWRSLADQLWSGEGRRLKPASRIPGRRIAAGPIRPRRSERASGTSRGPLAWPSVAAPPFVHLHVHSEYSILDGACRIPDLVEKAARLEMPAVSLTDHGSLAGAVQLFREAGKVGVKPIIGCEVYVADDRHAQTKGYAHLTLLAESNEGYANLIKLSSLGYLEGYYYKPRVDWELLERHAKGIVALSGCLSGRVSRALSESRPKDAAGDLDRLVQIFGRDSTYVEIQNAGLSEQHEINPQLIALAQETGLPLVATGDVHYLDAEDAFAHEALLCIQSGDTLKNPAHWRFDTNEFFFKTPEEMAGDFPGLEDAMARTLEVAERCTSSSSSGGSCCRRSRCPRAGTPSTTSSSSASRASLVATGT